MDIKPSKNREALNELKNRAHSFEQSDMVKKINDDLRHVIHDILYDIMYSGDISTAVSIIKKNKLIDGIEFTKRALMFGIEKEPYERELISRLLSGCYEIFNDNEIADGFQLILFRLPDISLDVPHATQIFSKFISRAIYDEIVPPIFIKEAYVDNVKAKECMSLAFARAHSVEAKESLEHIWGPGDFTSVVSLKIAVDTLLDEYLDNPDMKETTQAFAELNVPSFFGEVIKRGLFKSLERDEHARLNFINLLENWLQTNVIGDGHLKRGFSMAYTRLDDLKLDVPNAGKLMSEAQSIAQEKKLLPCNFVPVL